jgi:hypothetical protein
VCLRFSMSIATTTGWLIRSRGQPMQYAADEIPNMVNLVLKVVKP